ncbi:hypothetical protein D3981_004214 [Escherichia coli]|nr:hypothetical protein [Escherichia coli]
MFDYNDTKNYVRAELSELGIDFDYAEVIAGVSHCQSDEVSIKRRISAIELSQCVDIYVESLKGGDITDFDLSTLKAKLQYFLKVYDANARDYMEVEGKHYASSRIEYEDVCADILCESQDERYGSGYDREKYNELMKIDDRVLIARFALEQFWESDFSNFLSYITDSITDCLRRAYNTLGDMSLAYYRMSEYSYSRRINDEYTLTISLEEDNYQEKITDCYMEDVVLPNGKVVSKRNDEYLISIFNSVADESSVPMTACVRILDEDDEVVSELYRHTYASLQPNGYLKIGERGEIVREAFDQLRNEHEPLNAIAA